MQGEDRGRRVLLGGGRGVTVVVDFDAVDVEEPLADPVMPPGLLVVVVIAKTEATTLFLLRLREPLHWSPLHRGRGRNIVPIQRRGRQGKASWWRRKKATDRVLGWWPGVLFPELQLTREAHGSC